MFRTYCIHKFQIIVAKLDVKFACLPPTDNAFRSGPQISSPGVRGPKFRLEPKVCFLQLRTFLDLRTVKLDSKCSNYPPSSLPFFKIRPQKI